MKITMDGGITFEGTQAEYEAFLAFAERKAAEQEAPKVAVELMKGDSVKILGLSKYNANHIGQIGIVDGDAKVAGYVYVKVDGKNRIYDAKNLELVAKADDIITFEGAEYRKVDREAREGDVVIASETTCFITANKPYKVERHYKIGEGPGDMVSVYNSGRTRETVDVYAPIAESEPIAKSKPKYEPKVGDIVKIVSNMTFSENKIGDIGKVAKLGSDRFTVEVPNGPKTDIWTELDDIRPATAEEIAQYEKAVAKAEEEAKWAKLGRKVGEFKKGDVVRATKMILGHTEKYGGAIGKVEDTGKDMVGIRYHNGYCGAYTANGDVELIAPVESLLTQI